MDPIIKEIRLKGWATFIRAQTFSGLSKKDWCEKYGIKRHHFFKMQRLLRNHILDADKNCEALTLLRSVPEYPILETSISERVHEETVFVDLPVSTDTISFGRSAPEENQPSSGITIRHGKFSIDLDASVNTALLQKILKVISDVE